jgi:competence protein ComEC
MLAAAYGLCPGMAFPLFLFAVGACLVWIQSSLILGRALSVLLIAFGAGALSWNARHQEPPGDPLSRYAASHSETSDWIVEGKVRLSGLEASGPQLCDFMIDADSASTREEMCNLEGGVAVRWNGRNGTKVFAGDRVRVTGPLTVCLGSVNFGVHGYEDWLRGQGIHSRVSARGPDAVEIVARGVWWSPSYWASRLRETLTERLTAAVPESALPFVLAVWLGHRASIDAEEYQRYIDSGTAHILSVSGIHMAMVYVTASFLFRMFVSRPRRRAALTLFAVALFVLLSGVRLSALRAAVMVGMYVLAELFDREPDAPTALSLSALLLLGWNPDAMFDMGFQLSFLSVASILLYGEAVNSALRSLFLKGREAAGSIVRHFFVPHGDILRRPDATSSLLGSAERGAVVIRGGIAVSLAVQVLPTPLAINAFHVLPLLAVAANLIVVPLSTVVLWLCMMTSLSAAFSSSIALLFGHAIEPVVALIGFFVDTVAQPRFSHLTLTSPTIPAMVCYWSAAVMILGAMRATRKRFWMAGICAMLALAVFLWRPYHPQAMVAFLDVGHGDATFVRTSDGRTLLVDGGDRRNRQDAGKRIVAPFLWSNQVRRLDYVAASHGDSDHIGGLDYILRNFTVGEVLLSGTDWNRPHEKAFVELCAEMGLPIRRLFAGDGFNLGDASVEVLHPPATWPEDESTNNQSLVLRLQWEGASILLSGDIEREAEDAVSRLACHSTVLKAPHHGSETSSSEVFLEAVSPSQCIVSTGGMKGREPLDNVVLQQYVNRGIRVWRTDVLGGIRIVRLGGELVIEGARPSRGYPYPRNAEDPLSIGRSLNRP